MHISRCPNDPSEVQYLRDVWLSDYRSLPQANFRLRKSGSLHHPNNEAVRLKSCPAQKLSSATVNTVATVFTKHNVLKNRTLNMRRKASF